MMDKHIPTADTPNAKEPATDARSECSRLLCPTWYAVGGFVTCPVLAVMFVISAVTLVVVWPVMPFFLWFHRRDEIRRHNAPAHLPGDKTGE